MMPLMLLLACTEGGPANKDTDGPDYTPDTDTLPTSTCDSRANVELTLPSGTLTGPIPVTVSLRDTDSEPATLTLQWSTDGIVQHDLTVPEPLAELASSPEGEVYTFTWDSETDLGRALVSGITLQAVARSATCNPWPLGQLTDVTVDNSSIPEPLCAISLSAAESPVEGVADVHLVLTHPRSLPSTVSLSWTTVPFGADEQRVWTAAHLQAVDCDDDGALDGTSELSTSPDGVTHCLRWDSQVDVNADTTAWLSAACAIQGVEQDEQEIEVQVVNDPVPDPGELAIVEIMPKPRVSKGHYVELLSLAGHVLDLQGVQVGRWDSFSDVAGPPDMGFVIEVPSGVLAVDPGARVLLTGSDDPALSGCLAPDAVWPSTFLLQDDSTLALSHEGVLLASLPFTYDGGWLFRAGNAWAYDPSLAPADYANAAGWCAQTSTIAGCAELAATQSLGTPGAPNDACPAP